LLPCLYSSVLLLQRRVGAPTHQDAAGNKQNPDSKPVCKAIRVSTLVQLCVVILLGESAHSLFVLLHGDKLMASLQQHDIDLLDNWSFIKNYPRYRWQLIDLAKVTYRTVFNIRGAQSTRENTVDLYKEALIRSTIFAKWVDEKLFIRNRKSLRSAIANSLAVYVVYEEWFYIVK
jgi:hypothetical protein